MEVGMTKEDAKDWLGVDDLLWQPLNEAVRRKRRKTSCVAKHSWPNLNNFIEKIIPYQNSIKHFLQLSGDIAVKSHTEGFIVVR